MQKTKDEWLTLMEKHGVLTEGHFLLTSGFHTDRYLQCALLFQQPQVAEGVGRAMAEPYQVFTVDTVIGPAMGGIVAAHEVARALGCRAVFAERENGKMTLRRGFRLDEGERVVVVEDVVTTGGSVQEVVDVVKSARAEVIGISSVVNRSGEDAPFTYPYHPLLTLPIRTYAPDACPLCLAGEPLVKPGSRKAS